MTDGSGFDKVEIMTTNEAKRAICKLLWNYYQATGEETFSIRGDVLEGEGLDNSMFWTLVYPLLLSEGIFSKPARVNPENVTTVQVGSLRMFKKYRAFLFHVNKTKLIEAINKIEPYLRLEVPKVKITIDKTGIYFSENPKIIYSISGKRKEVAMRLLKKIDASAPIDELVELTGWDKSDVSHAVTKINTTFSEKLGINSKLIIRLDTGGYTFNIKELDINT